MSQEANHLVKCTDFDAALLRALCKTTNTNNTRMYLLKYLLEKFCRFALCLAPIENVLVNSFNSWT